MDSGIRFSISYHIRGITSWAVLFRKIKRGLLLLVALPLLIVVRLIRPLVLVRFSAISSEVIGMLASEMELYLCRDDKKFDVFYHYRKPCNLQLAKMWGRLVRVWNIASPVAELNRLIPGGEPHIIPKPNMSDIDLEGLFQIKPVHISFTEEEEYRGRMALEKMGVRGSFICFHARDAAYKEFTYPDVDTSYCHTRNSDINAQLLMAEEMTKRGYYMVRVGAVVDKPLETNNPMIIDYSTKWRSDFLDVYLCAKCYFYIGDEDGLNRVSATFRIPTVNLNTVPISFLHTESPNDILVWKRIRENGRYIPLREVFGRSLDILETVKDYAEAGLELVGNTPQEILELAIEMDERLKGIWQTTEEDEELQAEFWEIFKLNHRPERHGDYNARIGTRFLCESLMGEK